MISANDEAKKVEVAWSWHILHVLYISKCDACGSVCINYVLLIWLLDYPRVNSKWREATDFLSWSRFTRIQLLTKARSRVVIDSTNGYGWQRYRDSLRKCVRLARTRIGSVRLRHRPVARQVDRGWTNYTEYYPADDLHSPAITVISVAPTLMYTHLVTAANL